MGAVVSDIDGVSAREMVRALLEGSSPKEIAELARGKLCKKINELELSLDGRISDRHRLLLSTILPIWFRSDESGDTLFRIMPVMEVNKR